MLKEPGLDKEPASHKEQDWTKTKTEQNKNHSIQPSLN